MNEALEGIADRILSLSLAALKRANTDAVFVDPGMEHRESLAPLSAAHAGELLLKALIAKEHPLLLFSNLTDSSKEKEISLDWLLKRGKTHDFSKLPSLLSACTGIQIPDYGSFERLRNTRNQLQHFMDPGTGLSSIALEFIYKNIDPLLFKHFGYYACQFHEDEFDDHVIGVLLSHELKFSVPENLELTEINPKEWLKGADSSYQIWAEQELNLNR